MSKKLSRKYNKNIHKKNPIIIHIEGIQGSGKSYICSNINSSKVLCIDIDDLDLEIKDYIDSSGMPRNFDSLTEVWKTQLDKLILSNSKKGKNLIIIVGVKRIYMKNTAIDRANYKYFIKLKNIPLTYRRLFIRETQKILNNGNQIMKILNDKNIDEEELEDLINRTTNLSIPYPIDYDRYIDLYNIELEKASQLGYKIMTQDEIIKSINKLFR